MASKDGIMHNRVRVPGLLPCGLKAHNISRGILGDFIKDLTSYSYGLSMSRIVYQSKVTSNQVLFIQPNCDIL